MQKQEATIAQQQKQIEAPTAGLEKVSAQLAATSPSDGGLEASKPAPQVVSGWLAVWLGLFLRLTLL